MAEQTLEEKAVMVAKAIVNESSIWIGPTRYFPRELSRPGSGGHIFIATMEGSIILDDVTISLTPPEPELKPCPHCDCAVNFFEREDEYLIECPNCPCEMSVADRGKLIVAWNRRVG